MSPPVYTMEPLEVVRSDGDYILYRVAGGALSDLLQTVPSKDVKRNAKYRCFIGKYRISRHGRQWHVLRVEDDVAPPPRLSYYWRYVIVYAQNPGLPVDEYYSLLERLGLKRPAYVSEHCWGFMLREPEEAVRLAEEIAGVARRRGASLPVRLAIVGGIAFATIDTILDLRRLYEHGFIPVKTMTVKRYLRVGNHIAWVAATALGNMLISTSGGDDVVVAVASYIYRVAGIKS